VAPSDKIEMRWQRSPSVKYVLVIDVGGTSVKILATGQSERRSFSSGPTLPEANDFRGE
jgi:hypothetical protein